MKVQFAQYDVASATLSYCGGALLRISGEYTGAADSYLQIYDAAVVPDDAAQKAASLVESRLVQADFVYDFVFDQPLLFKNGISVCFSSTSPEKTIETDTGDFLGEMEVDSSLVGATRTAEDGASVTTTIPTTSKVVQVEVTNIAPTADQYLQMFDGAPTTTETKPLRQWKLLGASANQVTRLNFGPGTYLAAPTFAISSTANLYTAAGETTYNFVTFTK